MKDDNREETEADLRAVEDETPTPEEALLIDFPSLRRLQSSEAGKALDSIPF